MTFRSNFYDVIESEVSPFPMSRTSSAILNTMDRGLTAIHDDIGVLQQEIESRYSKAAERYAESSAAIASEIAEQAELNRQTMLHAASQITSAVELASVYLGGQIAEVRWAIDANTEATKGILDSLWKTHWIESRQYFDEGVRCYQNQEWEFARERFEKAVSACRTNGFAYQYLGFLAVRDDDQTQALRNFDLAAKFSPSDHHKAIAYFHMAKAWHAAGNETAALDQIRAAVELAPDDNAYKFELVRALMRTDQKKQALQRLKQLIRGDLRYWTAAAIDRTLDPMRAEITDLLDQMRKEAKVEADRIQANFLESIHLVAGIPNPLPLAVGYARVWEGSIKSPCEKGTVFEYRKIIETVPVSHRKCIENEISRYDTGLTEVRDKVCHLAADSRSRVETMRAEIIDMAKQAEKVDRDLAQDLAQLEQSYKSKEDGFRFAMGCSGVLAVLGGIACAGLVLRFALTGGAIGWGYTLGTLATLIPFLLIRPLVVVARKWILVGKKNNLRNAARASKSDIERQMQAAQKATSKAEKKSIEELKSKEAEFDTVRTACHDILARLRERRGIAVADGSASGSLWS